MRKVEAYETIDGELFANAKAAAAHEAWLELHATFNNFSANGRMGFFQVMHWIRDHGLVIKTWLDYED